MREWFTCPGVSKWSSGSAGVPVGWLSFMYDHMYVVYLLSTLGVVTCIPSYYALLHAIIPCSTCDIWFKHCSLSVLSDSSPPSATLMAQTVLRKVVGAGGRPRVDFVL